MRTELLKFSLILGLVVLIATGSLAWVNEITKPKIIEQQQKAEAEALNYVLPGTENGVIVPVNKKDAPLYYAGYSQSDTTNLTGYAFLTASKGYSSTIRTMVGIDTSGHVKRIQILSQQETPGLGTKCEEIKSGESEPWWQKQFINKLSTSVALEKEGGRIESLTGATVTSRAITDGIRQKAKSVLKTIEEKNI